MLELIPGTAHFSKAIFFRQLFPPVDSAIYSIKKAVA